jgi:putative endonuclease
VVWYEVCGTMEAAIAREKAIKEWKRNWKIRLIEDSNPEWRDLYEELL